LSRLHAFFGSKVSARIACRNKTQFSTLRAPFCDEKKKASSTKKKLEKRLEKRIMKMDFLDLLGHVWKGRVLFL
jgi:hypothetical protein